MFQWVLASSNAIARSGATIFFSDPFLFCMLLFCSLEIFRISYLSVMFSGFTVMLLGVGIFLFIIFCTSWVFNFEFHVLCRKFSSFVHSFSCIISFTTPSSLLYMTPFICNTFYQNVDSLELILSFSYHFKNLSGRVPLLYL